MGFKINKSRIKNEPILDELNLDTSMYKEPELNDGSLVIEESDTDVEIDFNPASQESYNTSAEQKTVIKTPLRDLEDKPEVSLDLTNVKLEGDIEGSDFKSDGTLKKQKASKGGRGLGIFSGIILIGALIVGFKVISSGNETIVNPEDNTDATTEDLAPQGSSGNGNSTTPSDFGGNSGTNGDEDTKEGYLKYINKYVDMEVQYPDNWFLTEDTQEGFNQIKELQPEGGIFSLSSKELKTRLPLVTLTSPDRNNEDKIIIEAHGSYFNIDSINAPLEFTKTAIAMTNIRLAQPSSTASYTGVNYTYSVVYNIYREIDVYTAVIQYTAMLGSNKLVVMYISPLKDVSQIFGYSRNPLTGEEEVDPNGTSYYSLDELLDAKREVLFSVLDSLKLN